MRASVPDKPNEYLVDGVNCAINTADGKYISVVESCDEVRHIIEEAIK
jgi:hypothetical protein